MPPGLSDACGFAGARVVGWRLRVAIFNPGWRNCERNSFNVLLVLCVVKCSVL